MRKKLKTPQYSSQTVSMHDRQTDDLPINSITAIAIVDDPYSNIGEKLSVTRSIRDDPLAGMLSRQYIDTAQFEAGRLWQRYHEHAEVGGISAIDPTRESVDGGKHYEPISDHQIRAVKKLNDAAEELGQYDNAIIGHILGQRLSISELAAKWCMTREPERRMIGVRFRGALEKLAVIWGLAGSCEKRRSSVRA